MNPHTILRRLTALVGAALAGLRVRRLIREARLGCSHVHDRDAAARLRAIGWRTIAAVDATDDALDEYAGVADALVLDSTDERGAGGTGETHDWARARAVVADLDTPVLLAGGLTPENVSRAVRTVDPFGVDVSSGIEESGGAKDHDALRRFVDRATGEPLRA